MKTRNPVAFFALCLSSLAASLVPCASAAATPPPSPMVAPYGLALDTFGNLYVADGGANAIWKITADTKIALLAGNPATPADSTDGKGAAARFNNPTNLVTRSGTLYVADTLNNTIRTVSPDGTVRTFAGTPNFSGTHYREGTGANAIFCAPVGIAIDDAGQLYTADAGNGYIRKIILTGTTSWLAGASLPENFTSTGAGAITLTSAASLTLSAGPLGISSTATLYGVSGTVSWLILDPGTFATTGTLAGTYLGGLNVAGGNTLGLGGGGVINSTFNYGSLANTSTLVLSTTATTLDSGNWNQTFNLLNLLDPNTLTASGSLNLVPLTSGTTLSTGDIIFSNNDLLQGGGIFTSTTPAPASPPIVSAMRMADDTFSLSQIVVSGTSYAAGEYYFSVLGGMTLHPDGTHLYVAANLLDICAINISDGSVTPVDTAIFGDYTNPLRPVAANLRFDNAGNLYIADTGNARILKVTVDGAVTCIAGGGTPDADGNYESGHKDGLGAEALFNVPTDIAIDAAGNIYVADSGNGVIRKIDAITNTVTTLVLEEVSLGSMNNGIGSAASDGGGGGGGGALSAWYLLALAALGVARLRRR